MNNTQPPRRAEKGCPAERPVPPDRLMDTLLTPCKYENGKDCEFRKICEQIAAKRGAANDA